MDVAAFQNFKLAHLKSLATNRPPQSIFTDNKKKLQDFTLLGKSTNNKYGLIRALVSSS